MVFLVGIGFILLCYGIFSGIYKNVKRQLGGYNKFNVNVKMELKSFEKVGELEYKWELVDPTDEQGENYSYDITFDNEDEANKYNVVNKIYEVVLECKNDVRPFLSGTGSKGTGYWTVNTRDKIITDIILESEEETDGEI